LGAQSVAAAIVGARFYPSAPYVVGEERERKESNSLLDYSLGLSVYIAIRQPNHS
jgi:hypothetical protein